MNKGLFQKVYLDDKVWSRFSWYLYYNYWFY
jgi:hypothetical protein